MSVSIDAPARGATEALPDWATVATFQSTPLHEGRPTSRQGEGTRCFNPRPCTRGDCGEGCRLKLRPRFNPRPCTRGDRGGPEERIAEFVVSIHAPARGATSLSMMYCRAFSSFNPRPCTRGDDQIYMQMIAMAQFQSTPLHEGRLQKSKALKLLRISSEIRAPSERTDDFVCLPFYEIHLSK